MRPANGLVHSDEVPAVQREQRAFLRHGEIEDFSIGNRTIGVACLLGGQDVVSPRSVIPGRRTGVRFRWNRNEPSGRFVATNLLLYIFGVSPHVAPGVGKILGAKRRIGVQEGLFGEAVPPGLFQNPDGDSGAYDAGLASADVDAGVHAGKIIAQFLDDPFQKLGFFPARE